MSKLQTLLLHPDMASCNHFRVTTGASLIGLSEDEKIVLSEPLGNNEIFALLSEIIPEKMSEKFNWGNVIQYTFETPNKNFNFAIRLDEQEQIEVEILAEKPVAEVKEEETTKDNLLNREIDAQILDQLMEGDSLIYNPSKTDCSQIIQILNKQDIEPRESDDPAAIVQTINYKQFNVFVMVLNQGFREDPVYKKICEMLMDSRRQQFTILISPELESKNDDLAYALGVQMVMNSNDLSEIEKSFEKSHIAWKRVLTPFNEALSEHGKL